MATTQRSEYLINAAQDLRIDTAREAMPVNIAPNVQMVYDLKPTILCISKSSANVTSSTALSTGDRDVYVLSAALSVVKDITSTSTESGVKAYIGGTLRQLLTINTTSLLVEGRDTNIVFPFPGIKIDRNTDIVVTNSTNVANVTASANICYYIMSK